MKLFPIVANMFAMSTSADTVSQKYAELMRNLKKGVFTGLEELHHYTSGFKALYTQDANDSLFVIRQSIGGAGYSAWSGIPRSIEDYSAQVTFEGDNTVMAQ